MSKSIAVLGGGPGGYVAAIRAAQLGASVTLVEQDTVGGTCLNRGCIPTKVLLHTIEMYEEVRKASGLGLDVADCKVNWATLLKRKATVVRRLTGGIGHLLKQNGVTVLKGKASFASAHEVTVTNAEGNISSLKADNFIIATGSVPAVPPVPGFDLPGISTSNEALDYSAPPKSLLLVGGGVIGVELACVFAPLGTEVTIVEMLPEIMPNVDKELVGIAKKMLKGHKIDIHTASSVAEVKAAAEGFTVTVKGESKFEKTVEHVLVCAGRRPYTAGLDLEKAGVEAERGRVKVDEHMRTNVPHIHAIGDCCSPVMLAHVASREGEVAVENIMGHKHAMDYRVIPGAIYCSPEIGWVGITEQDAEKQGLKVKIGRFPLAANSKCMVMNEGSGMIKIIADEKTDKILGVHIMGPRATDMIAEAGLAMQMNASVKDIIATIHAHPTVSEAMGEAALAVFGHAIHTV